MGLRLGLRLSLRLANEVCDWPIRKLKTEPNSFEKDRNLLPEPNSLGQDRGTSSQSQTLLGKTAEPPPRAKLFWARPRNLLPEPNPFGQDRGTSSQSSRDHGRFLGGPVQHRVLAEDFDDRVQDRALARVAVSNDQWHPARKTAEPPPRARPFWTRPRNLLPEPNSFGQDRGTSSQSQTFLGANSTGQ